MAVVARQMQRGGARTGVRCHQILDAAGVCFAEQGFHGTSMARLARAAGMSVGHIYHYFDSKEAIIAAIVQQELAKRLEVFEQLKKQDDVLQALIDRADQGLATRMDKRETGLRLEILAEAGRSPQIAAALRAADEAVRRTFREVVAKALGRRAAMSAADLEARIEVVIGVFDGMMIRAVRHPDLDRAAALRALKLAIRHLLTAPAAQPPSRPARRARRSGP
jgi:TetR/AcrR family transcriptional regulator, repressor for uid operon